MVNCYSLPPDTKDQETIVHKFGLTLGAALSVAFLSTSAYAATEIAWWHAMGGELGKKLEEVAQKFNDSQTDYHVTPVFKGTYPETLTAAIAAFRANQQPAIVQVFEVGTGTMMAAKGAVYPVHQLMVDQGEPWDPSGFLAPVVGYYSDAAGNILSMPFNSSTPIMYYNKDVFTKAGLDPEVAPKTWAEIGEFTKKISSTAAPPPAALPSPMRRPGLASRTTPPSRTCPTAPSRTASVVSTPNSHSTARNRPPSGIS